MIVYYENNENYIQKRLDGILYNSDLVYDRQYRNFVHYYSVGCGFDIETSKIKIRENFVVSVVYHWQFGVNGLTVGGRSLESMISFLKMLDYVASLKNARLLILDANLNFEFQNCKHFWKELGITELFAKDKREPLRMLVGKSLYFVECLGLFGNSLANIADNYTTLKKLKGDLDHSLIRNSLTPLKDYEQDYCENDVQILVQLGNYIFKNFFCKKEKFPLTSTARIRNNIKKRIGKKLKAIKNEIKSYMPVEEDYEILRAFLFKGGICGTNSEYMGLELRNLVKMADYTSDYPAKCFHYAFPMGGCKRVEPTPENILNAIDKHKPFILKIKFVNLKSTTTHSVMSSHKCLNSKSFNTINSTIDNGRIFRANECVLFLNDVELLDFAFFNEDDLSAYTFDREKTQILQMWTFSRYEVLPDYVLDEIEEEYRKKAELKVKLKKCDDYFKKYKKYPIPFDEYMNLRIAYRDSKSAVNGIFGMMCTALYLDDLEFDGDIIDNVKNENGEYQYKSYDEAISNLFLYPFWGFWITSYARHVLIQTIIRFPDVIVQYDTDSIYFIDNGSEQSEALKKYMQEFNFQITEQNNELFENDPIFEDLGCWDINEKSFKNFKGLGSKRYMYEDESGTHVTITGCRSIEVVEYQGKTISENEFHLKRLDEKTVNEVMKTKRLISTMEYQYIDSKSDCTLFEFFQDEMKVDKKHSNKLCSKYLELDDILKEIPSLKISVTDYENNTCEMSVSSCLVLEEVEFKMGIKDTHAILCAIIQNSIKNSPDNKIDIDKVILECIEKLPAS
jgi:hypothetical protein